MPNLPDPVLYAVPFFILTVIFEWVLVLKGRLKGAYETKDAAASLSMGVGNLISGLLMGFISASFLFFVWKHRIFDWGVSVWAIAAAVVAQDFLYYWKHRWYHEIRWFWSAHVVHHSSEHYNLTTALRQPWNNHITGQILLTAPLIFLGMHPAIYAFVGSLNLVYQYWIHTEAINKMPKWYEAVMNTPSHHRVHHATNPRYLDSNYAGIFIIWDKMFGTFVPEMPDKEEIKYGVVKPIETYNPLKIAFAEMISIFRDVSQKGLTLKQRFLYAFAAPGYSHDGSRKNSTTLKADYAKDNPSEAGTPGLPNIIDGVSGANVRQL